MKKNIFLLLFLYATNAFSASDLSPNLKEENKKLDSLFYALKNNATDRLYVKTTFKDESYTDRVVNPNDFMLLAYPVIQTDYNLGNIASAKFALNFSKIKSIECYFYGDYKQYLTTTLNLDLNKLKQLALSNNLDLKGDLKDNELLADNIIVAEINSSRTFYGTQILEDKYNIMPIEKIAVPSATNNLSSELFSTDNMNIDESSIKPGQSNLDILSKKLNSIKNNLNSALLKDLGLSLTGNLSNNDTLKASRYILNLPKNISIKSLNSTAQDIYKKLDLLRYLTISPNLKLNENNIKSNLNQIFGLVRIAYNIIDSYISNQLKNNKDLKNTNKFFTIS